MATSRDKIKTALLDLLEQFPFSELNISSVCSKAGLSRRTFTRYYSSLEDVAKEQVRDDALGPAAAIMETLPVDIMMDPGYITYASILRAIYAHRTFYRRVSESFGSMWCVEQYMDATKSMVLQRYLPDVIPEDEVGYAEHFFRGAAAMAIKWWVEGDFAASPEWVALLIMRWHYGHLNTLPIANKTEY